MQYNYENSQLYSFIIIANNNYTVTTMQRMTQHAYNYKFHILACCYCNNYYIQEEIDYIKTAVTRLLL